MVIMLLFASCSYFKTAKKEDAVFDPEESLKEANQLIRKGYFEDAREILETIKAKDASRKYSTVAELRIADTYFEDELYEEAIIEYRNFLSMHTHHKYASYAQYKLAMSYFKQIKTVDVSYSWAKKAKYEFELLQRRYPRNPYMNITDNRIKMCNRVLAEYEFYVANFYFKKGSYDAAVKRFTGMLENYPDSKKESEALYYLGLSYHNLGERDKALHALNILLNKYPAIELSNNAKELVASLNKDK